MKKLCIACSSKLDEVSLNDIKVLVCTNPKCTRVGLLTVLYAHLEKKGKDEKKGKKD